jgi:hypothetical protein
VKLTDMTFGETLVSLLGVNKVFYQKSLFSYQLLTFRIEINEKNIKVSNINFICRVKLLKKANFLESNLD